MNFPKRSQAYPRACKLCWSPLGVWAGWYGWSGCGEHKFSYPYFSKCPGTRFASLSWPPSERRWAHGRVRTTLKSTQSSSYGSLGLWHTLGSHLHHIYGWEASWTTLVYTTHIHSTCTKVGSDAPQRRKRVREHRGSLGLLCSPSCPPINWAVYWGGEAGPGPSLALSAATGARWWFVMRAEAAAVECAAALTKRSALCAANAASIHLFGLYLGGGDDRRRLRGLKRPKRVVCRRH